MTKKRFPWEWLLALLIGIGLGLTYAWVISPVKYIDATPAALREDFKDNYRAAIAAAYASTGDLERARARLALVSDPDPVQALTAQAQRMLAAGESYETVEQVTILVAALQGHPLAATVTETPYPMPINPTSVQSTQEGLTVAAPTAPIESPPVTDATTNIPAFTPTALPTHTPTPTQGIQFIVTAQDTICDPNLSEGLLQIVVTNATRKQLPGMEIIVTWDAGEEHIFTGFKPEIGNGYADYLMTPSVSYSVRMAGGGDQVSDIVAPTCVATDGSEYIGGLRINFQQP